VFRRSASALSCPTVPPPYGAPETPGGTGSGADFRAGVNFGLTAFSEVLGAGFYRIAPAIMASIVSVLATILPSSNQFMVCCFWGSLRRVSC
jgi:hypothetical protein